MKLYKITDWARAYETHETRKLAALRWVPIPNKHDGLTFRQIGTEPDAAGLFAAWILIVQIASKSDRDRRGTLFRNGKPMQARDMALVTGFPVKLFARALEYFAQPSVGWLIAEEYADELPLLTGHPGASPGNPAAPAENLPPNGREGNGMEGIEGNGKEGNAVPASPEALTSIPLPFDSPEFAAAWKDFEQHRRELKKKLTPTAIRQNFADFKQWGEARAIAAIRFTIGKGWQGIREDRDAPRFAPIAGRSELGHKF